MEIAEMLLRLGAGVGLGTLIGFERQYRARMAGLRTNALVAAGAALLVLLPAYGVAGSTADPPRGAAQLLPGIRFPGPGVVLGHVLPVRRLQPPSPMCSSGAVGSLAGAGLYESAVAGTVVVVVVNVVLRPLGGVVDRRPDTGREAPTRDTFRDVTQDKSEAHVRNLLVQDLSRTDFALQSVESRNAGAVNLVEVCAALTAEQRDDKQMEAAVSRLSLEPSVTSVRWQVDDRYSGRDE
ncbi:MgtC/SapB family protein [Microbacterium sp. HSID17254]|uniref:MgtC/SapB family protein n=1 Tax=Microbacterium sp. HSID17254 TaxID=2419509 RepID=UPI000F887799|nr:MgtC/SapB family protein [Microbacterium sp. HSID17254]RUQ02551.1 MgtC/SapB family protein [Microbacterium sp. HSID17254]